ncbi:MAG: Jag N-terminal domain-containing protein [Anaerolineae bacterium]|nr:Jag N-terminal domain-containing protein [Anaerolineae bacterium]
MGQKVVETKGSDVEAAIQAGLAQLGLSRDAVEIEVLDEGSRGLLGIGARNAQVRLTAQIADQPVVDKPVVETPAVVKAPIAEPVVSKSPPKSEPAPKMVKTAVPVEEDEETIAAREEEQAAAVEIVTDLLERMHVDASLTTSLSEPDDVTGRIINILEIHGDDLSTLIGPRGDTLNALQYISRLMVGHKLRTRAGFVIDVEGYRQRREQALARLADRMARKVAKRKRAMSLEPMPPHERRIIHMTLRDDKYVYTESIGEGNRRKVKIIPKRS